MACSDGAAVGSVTSVDVPCEGVVCSDGAVVGSVASVVVPSVDVERSDGAVLGDDQQPLDGVFRSSYSEAQFTANGMPVIMLSSSFLLTTSDISYDSGVTSLGRMPGVDNHQPCGGDDDELAESRHALNDHIQARRRKKRLRKGVSVSGSLLT